MGKPIYYRGRIQCQTDANGYGDCYLEGLNREIYVLSGDQIGGGRWSHHR